MPGIKQFLKTASYIFGVLGILFIPFPFYLTGLHQQVSDTLFHQFIIFFADSLNVFLPTATVTSDSTSMYILFAILLIISLFLALIVGIKFRRIPKNIVRFINSGFAFYLSFQLFNYGADKIFKTQFYIPEPNTLYTAFGRMEKGMLFWSTMGTSHFYSVFMGIMEILPAILLLFRKTRFAGATISFAVLINIVAVNFGFDISVKLYSLFLLFLSIIIMTSYLIAYRKIFLQRLPVVPQPPLIRNKPLYTGVKTFIVGIILIEAFLPGLRSGIFNDDNAPRPFLHGMYQVQHDCTSPVKRFFIHRNGYIIFEDQHNNMKDYKLEINTVSKKFIMTGYDMKHTETVYLYNEKDSTLTLNYYIDKSIYPLHAKMINWNTMPAVNKQFHWASDQP